METSLGQKWARLVVVFGLVIVSCVGTFKASDPALVTNEQCAQGECAAAEEA